MRRDPLHVHCQSNDTIAGHASLDSYPSQGSTDFLGLRLFIHGIPLLGLLLRLRNSPLALSKLFRLANSRVRHIGCWGRRRLEKKVGKREGVWSTAGG